MRTAINPKYFRYLAVLAFTVMITALSGCTLDGISDTEQQEEVTQADLEAASRILGESLSDENDGVMASLNDALTTVSSSGFETQGTFLKQKSGGNTVQTHDDDSNTGRGEERNFSYSYSSATGIHTITFERVVHDGEYYKSVSDTLKYVFTDANGEFIAFPRQEKSRIETIDYKGKRIGQIQSPERESEFARQDTFFIDGASEASNILAIDGVHHGNGDLSTTDDAGNPISRSYSTSINFLDIQIDKAVVAENGSLEHGVTGTLSWEMTITHTTNGQTRTKTIRGTVEMNGDGTALLRFEGFTKLFLINLDDGHVRDHDDEFEGRVKHVNINEGTFTLASGRVIQMTDGTDVDPEGDVFDLEGVVRALENGKVVEAEGTGSVDGDVFVASTVKFEVGDPAEEHFEGHVNGVNLDAHTITIGDGLTIRFGEESVISESGDLYSLAAVKEALGQGHGVKVYGYGKADDATDADMLALEAKFKYSMEEFEGHVTAVNLDMGTFTLDQEITIRLDDLSIIAEKGNLYSLQEVAQALEAGADVVAYGYGRIDSDTESRLVATKVVFKAQPEDFEGTVTSVNLDAGTFTLDETLTIRIGEISVISESGEYHSLEAVNNALGNGQSVIGFGDGVYDRWSDARLLAYEVRFDPAQ